MNNSLNSLINSFRFGGLRQHQNLAVIPLHSDVPASCFYLTLGQAFQRKEIVVEELGNGGQVPQIKLTNLSELPVLILDGEELLGAMQNRIVNTTMLIAAKRSVVIPVSCTERGRWFPQEFRTKFRDSGHIMASCIRARKDQAVLNSLKVNRGAVANQLAIWNDVDKMHSMLKTQSITRAMADSYRQRQGDLNDYLKAIPVEPGQRGLIVFLNGAVAGMEYVSLTTAYNHVHARIMYSYAIDAIAHRTEPQDFSEEHYTEQGMSFLEKWSHATESSYKPVDLGEDYRYESRQFIGSALLYNNELLHMKAFARKDDDRKQRGYFIILR